MSKLFTPIELAVLQNADIATLKAGAASNRQIAAHAQAKSARKFWLKRALRLEAEIEARIVEAQSVSKLTTIERRAIQGVLDSDYMDALTGADAVDQMVWTWSANPFGNKPTFSGAVSSLVKKGFVRVNNNRDDDGVIWITRAGMDAFEGKD